MYTSFNIASDIYFLLNRPLKKTLSHNSAYKNLHHGDRCFILGTGPSLLNITESQIETLKKEKIFAVNSLYKTEKTSDITPTYYALLDNIYWGIYKSTFEEILEKYKSHPPVFITDYRAKKHIPKEAQSIYLHAKNYPTNKIRYDLTSNISITMNVVSFCITSAIYMGFKEIYLLGCDYSGFVNYKAGSHSYDDKSEYSELTNYNLAFYLKYYHLTTEFHYKIARLAKDKNIQIKNLTPNSLLDAYPITSIENILPNI